jgi:hypothetical protein
MIVLTHTRRSFSITSALVLLLIFVSCTEFSLAQTSRRQQRRQPRPKELIAELEPQADPQNWKTFTSAAGSFSVLTPGELSHEQRAAQSSDGSVQMHVFTYYANAEYSISYADYLAVIENQDRQSQFLNAVRDAGVKGINGRLLEDKEITLDGHPGRSYRVEYGTDYGFLLVGRNVVVGQRLYIVSTTYRKNALAVAVGSYEAWALKFLDSFRLTRPTSPLTQ